MTSKNTENVNKWRGEKGNDIRKEIYTTLREKYGIKSTIANKLKFQSVEAIQEYIKDNNLQTLENCRLRYRL